MTATAQIYRTKTKSIDYVHTVKIFQGVDHLIVPVVMMVEGVHHGSRGPLLHTIAELGRFPESWNGIPVTIGHPQQDEHFVSANSPEVLEKAVGRIFNTHVDGTKLKAEAWLDVAKLTALSPEAYAYINEGKPLEVSVGVFSEEEEATGEFNGGQYTAIARSHRPDHLALLPGETGACSWNDGCGVRANQSINKGGPKVETIIQTLQGLVLPKDDAESIRNAILKLPHIAGIFTANEASIQERMEAIYQKVNAMDDDTRSFFIEEAYSDYLIYRVRRRNSQDPPNLYRQNYSMNEQGAVEFTGDPVQVRKEVKFINTNTNKQMDVNSKKTPCCLAKVEQLITHKGTKFTEANKEWLLSQDETTLDLLFPEVIEPAVNLATVTPEQAMNALKESIKDPESFIKLMPDAMQDQMRSGLNLHAQYRANLVNNVLTNAEKDAWTKEELEKQDTAMLEKLSKQFKTPVDYSGQIGKTISVNKTEEALLPPGVKE